MHTPASTSNRNKSAAYERLRWELQTLLQGETDFIANLANTAALLYHTLPDINWAGFYLLKSNMLVLGPFQGKPACARIAIGQGVCGTAAARRTALVVPNVNEFAGHIVCDAASNAEIVLPLLRADQLLGVLDVDSPAPGRFDEEDRVGLEELIRILLAAGSSQ